MRFFLPVSIVLLWLTTTTLLVLKNYFPDETRYPKVDREFVADLFFSKGSSSDLAILKDGEVMGRLTITPRPHPTSKVPSELARPELREVFFSGYLLQHTEDLPLGQLSWNGSLYMAGGFEVKGVRTQVRMPNFGVVALATVSLDPPDFDYQLRQGQQVIMDSTDPEKSEETMAQLRLLAQMQGQALDPSLFSGNGEQLLAALKSFEPKVDCRHGQFKILDDPADGYLVTLSFIEDFKLKFYISELGELLKVEGLPEMTVLGEAFVPEDKLAPGDDDD